MTTTRIYSPEGRVGSADRALAPSPELLTGQRIGVLDNGKPGAAYLMTEIARHLVDRTGASLGPIVAKGSAATPCEDDVFARILGEADLVLTGTAD